MKNLAISTIVVLVAFVITFILSTGLRYSLQLKTTPAIIFEIGELVNGDYRIVATDSKNTLWLQKRNDDCTYVATVSSDYPNLKMSEKIICILNGSVKETINIEITDQAEKQE